MADKPIKLLIERLRPLLKGTRSRGRFLAALIDFGLTETEGYSSKSALELRKERTWKGYANGNDDLSEPLASELAGRWDSYQFGENLIHNYGEGALIDLVPALKQVDPLVNKMNVGYRLGEILYNIFKQTAGHVDAAVPDALTAAIDAMDRNASPYIDYKTNKLRLGDDSLKLPPKPDVPKKIQSKELTYVRALLHAYCEDKACLGEEVTIDDIPPRLVQHFSDQRKAFYSAEWVKETSWDCIDGDQTVFDSFLETMFQGVIDVNLDEHPTELKRLLATLAQAANVQLDNLKLAQIIDLIDIWSRKGSCHELVALNRLGWSA